MYDYLETSIEMKIARFKDNVVDADIYNYINQVYTWSMEENGMWRRTIASVMIEELRGCTRDTFKAMVAHINGGRRTSGRPDLKLMYSLLEKTSDWTSFHLNAKDEKQSRVSGIDQ